MITGHEDMTRPLTEKELGTIIPVLIKGLAGKTKDNPVTNDEIRAGLKARGYGAIGAARVRKMINYIRGESLLPVLATKEGYFTSHEPKEIKEEIESLEQRVQSMVYSINGLKKILHTNTKQTELSFKSWQTKQ